MTSAMTDRGQLQKTIVSLDETMIVVDGKTPKSRLVWRAAGLDIFVQGVLGGIKFEQASNMACQIALGMHIPLASLRYQGKRASKKNDTDTRKMFS